ncbi:MAG: M23 family metallopeptidase [Anaerolineales bacterium]|nr:M23 family metallopeptidase [Anaerolineales bacterium]
MQTQYRLAEVDGSNPRVVLALPGQSNADGLGFGQANPQYCRVIINTGETMYGFSDPEDALRLRDSVPARRFEKALNLASYQGAYSKDDVASLDIVQYYKDKAYNIVEVEATYITPQSGPARFWMYAGYGLTLVSGDCATAPVQAQLPECIVDGNLTNGASYDVLRVPVSNNLPSSKIPASANSRDYKIIEKHVDYKNVTWFYVSQIFLQGGTTPSGDAITGWVEKSFFYADENNPPPCLSTLLRATRYDIDPNDSALSWRTYEGNPSPKFSDWPVDPAILCETPRREIHTLGIQGRDHNYPRGTHHAADFFIPTDRPIHARAVADGIVVGINIDGNEGSHYQWGGTVSETSGYAVIIRHGHFYILYGHLESIHAESIYVGAVIRTGEQLGVIGQFTADGISSETHLHLEVHSYGSQVYNPEADPPLPLRLEIAPNGILPRQVGTAGEIIPPHLYDVMQFLPSSDASFAFSPDVLTNAPNPFDPQKTVGQASLQVQMNCFLDYYSALPGTGYIVQHNGYRGFVGYGTEAFASPLVITEPNH